VCDVLVRVTTTVSRSTDITDLNVTLAVSAIAELLATTSATIAYSEVDCF